MEDSNTKLLNSVLSDIDDLDKVKKELLDSLSNHQGSDLLDTAALFLQITKTKCNVLITMQQIWGIK